MDKPEKCSVCPNNRNLLKESLWLARAYCLAVDGNANYLEYHNQCLACSILGITDLGNLDQAFQDRRFAAVNRRQQ